MLNRLLTFCFVFTFMVLAVCMTWVCTAQETGQVVTPIPADGVVKPYQLRVEFLTAPQGIDELKPRFSWKLKSDQNDQTQSAYQIIVYRTERTTSTDSKQVEIVWDSGKVAENTVLVEYAGKPLLPKSEYMWLVIIWDKQDNKQWSSSSTFTTGIFKPEQWQAKWIGLDDVSLEEKENEKSKVSLDGAAWIWTNEKGLNALPGHAVFRKTIDLNESPLEINKATLALTADNEFTAYLNNKQVGSGSNFKTAKIIDVTEYLKQGKNVLAVDVANHGDAPNPAGLIGVLRIQYKNETELSIKTDTTWKAIDGLPEGFETATFDDSAWKNTVKIADLGGSPWGNVSANTSRPSPPARFLTKSFGIKGKPIRATAYISGLGYYELLVNNKKIGNHVLDPVLTDYDKRVPYVTYDIDPEVLQSSDNPNFKFFNKIVVKLGNGRYYAPRTNDPIATRTFGFPKLLFQFEIQYADGSTQTVVSDENWFLSTNTSIRDNNDYDGEIYDARKSKVPFSEFVKARIVDAPFSEIVKAQIVDAPKGKLVAQMMQPMRVIEEIAPVSVKEVKPGVWVFD
ncbi:MAG: alpha-L-rhamnosidase N-terminal domain-containing protein, partial [Planctomycetaceae bacterium]|nr:alpha-L-rhamnosidase N-terminal domain-containing protein [Planctomycetaceae bacterium]